MNFKTNLPYIIIIVIGLSALTFAGVKIIKGSNKDSGQAAQSQASVSPDNARQGMGGQTDNRGQVGNRGNFTPLHGAVTSVNSDSVVMKADDSTSKNISISSDTRISRMDNGQRETLTLADIKTGDEINVIAQDTTSPNITARMIIIGTFTPPQRGSSDQGGGNQEQAAPKDNMSGTSLL